MPTTKIEIVSASGVNLGYVHLDSTSPAPAFLLIDGTIYQRYGWKSHYRYILEPDTFIPEPSMVTLT